MLSWSIVAPLADNSRVIRTFSSSEIPAAGAGTFLYENVSALPHYDAFVRGLVELSSLVYFGLSSALFLWANSLVLERNRA